VETLSPALFVFAGISGQRVALCAAHGGQHRDRIRPSSAQTISGTSIITDLCNRIAEKLYRSGDLRSVDAYSSYAAKVSIELQLVDIDTANIDTEVAVGVMNPDLPSRHILIGERADAEETDDTQERNVDGSLPVIQVAVAGLRRCFDVELAIVQRDHVGLVGV
jgi:hypothetical protein